MSVSAKDIETITAGITLGLTILAGLAPMFADLQRMLAASQGGDLAGIDIEAIRARNRAVMTEWQREVERAKVIAGLPPSATGGPEG